MPTEKPSARTQQTREGADRAAGPSAQRHDRMGLSSLSNRFGILAGRICWNVRTYEIRVLTGGLGGNCSLPAGMESHMSEVAFNVAKTGYDDAALRYITAREMAVTFAGCTGGRGGFGHIEFLWVRSDDRGSGPGTRLLAAAEQEVTRRG